MDEPSDEASPDGAPAAAASDRKYLRQPIVSVLGHVDHGKTSLLDRIRGGNVAKREPGAITQHIGATEVPIDAILQQLGPLGVGKKFNVPGLLFIDTPGHHSFNSLRARGGALADLAILVIDLNEGPKPQTLEAIRILRRTKTPFVIAANKIDLVTGYQSTASPFILNVARQTESARDEIERRLYNLIGKLGMEKLPSERYDRISDFTKNIALVPCSAKTAEGLPDLLLVLVGLAQRFLEERLETTEAGPAIGTVLEVREERGLGLTVDAIIYGGTLRASDRLAIGGKNGPVTTQVRALLRPKPMDEIRDPREPFTRVRDVHAAAGVKIVAPNLEDVLPGAPLRVVRGRPEADILDEVRQESELKIELDDLGILIKADTMGSLEALSNELKGKSIRIRAAGVGPVARREVIEIATLDDPLDRVILAFNVPVLPDAAKEADARGLDLLASDVIYTLLDLHEKWLEKSRRAKDEAERLEYTHPASLKFLEGNTFRTSNPAVIGVRVLAGRIQPGKFLLKADGKSIGPVKSIQKEGKSVPVAIQGAEVALAVEGVTVGRQIREGEVFWTDLTGLEAKHLFKMEKLTSEERDALEKIALIKRRKDRFWGM